MSLLKISPYVSWKGISTNSIVPSYSRPDPNATGTAFKANPIKHWRKQLIPTPNSGSQRVGISLPMNTPGGSVYLGNVPENTSCLLATDSAAGIKEDITKIVCVPCNPAAKQIRRASTLLNKNYYTDTKGYLRSRGISYIQNLTQVSVCPIPISTSCNPNPTVYKPNNTQFSQQGAVDSSSRITRLKLDTVNKNAASYQATFGTTAPKYLGMASTPYFLKSKYQPIFTS